MPDTDPLYDASRVMLNGAAIGLVTSLVAGMEARNREALVAMEQRITEKITSQDVDIEGLEAWRASIVEARLRREGQWSVFLTVGKFANRYGRAILGLAIAFAATVLALLGGVNVSIGG